MLLDMDMGVLIYLKNQFSTSGEKWFCTNFIDYGITNTKKDKVFPMYFL